MRGVLPFALCALVLRASAWSVAPPTLPGVRHAPHAPAVRVVLLLPPPPPQSGALLADGGAPEERWLRRRVARAVRGARSTLNAALNVLLALLVCVAPLCAPPAIAALIEEAPYSRLFVLVSARSGLCMGGATGSNLAVICLGRWQ